MNKFTLIGEEPYTKKDGSLTTLSIWEGVCAKPDCKNKFLIKTPKGKDSRAFARLHCDLHKATRQECIDRAAAVNRILSDADIIEIRKLASEGLKPSDLTLIFPATANTLREIIAGRSRPLK